MSDPAPPLLRLSGLTRRFTTHRRLFSKGREMVAVRELSLSVERRSIVGIVGESGCGKSTLAQLILRLIDPSAGQILFDGMDITRLSFREMRPVRKRLQMVFQDPYSSLDPRYTVADILSEPSAACGESIKAERIGWLLSEVGLPASLARSYPHQLSGGQRQRVGIARALASNPDFIVLDEPTASLDVSVQAQIIALLQRLRGELGLTYLFISHDLGLVRYFCSRIVVMYLGAIVEDLPNLHQPPCHPYTRMLIDSAFAPDPKTRRAQPTLEGEIPSPYALPTGCAFASRCRQASERCRKFQPVLRDIADDRKVACFHPVLP